MWSPGWVGLVSYKLFMYIIGHQNVHILRIMVPIQTYATVQFSFPIYFHFIEVFQRIYQMLCIILANLFNPQIIYYQREPHRSCIVLVDPIARNIAFPCFLTFVFLLYCLLCQLLLYCQCGLEWLVGDGQVHGA